jgi:hypothetical protein
MLPWRDEDSHGLKALSWWQPVRSTSHVASYRNILVLVLLRLLLRLVGTVSVIILHRADQAMHFRQTAHLTRLQPPLCVSYLLRLLLDCVLPVQPLPHLRVSNHQLLRRLRGAGQERRSRRRTGRVIQTHTRGQDQAQRG